MPRNTNDPRWISARYAGRCRCGAPVIRGHTVAYYPVGKVVLGKACGCADRAMADFEAARVGEEGAV